MTETPPGGVGRLPEGERRRVAVVVALRGGRILVARRAEGTHLAGAWEFPGGKIEDGESPAAAARRELLEETGLEAPALDPLVLTAFDYGDRVVEIHAFLAEEPIGKVRIDGERPARWTSLDELFETSMPPANDQILRALNWRQTGRPAPPRDV